MKTFFFFDFNQDDIIPNLTDAAPGDDIFAFTTWKKAEFTWAWYNQGSDFAGFTVKFKVNRTAEAATGTGVYDFLLSKFA